MCAFNDGVPCVHCSGWPGLRNESSGEATVFSFHAARQMARRFFSVYSATLVSSRPAANFQSQPNLSLLHFYLFYLFFFPFARPECGRRNTTFVQQHTILSKSINPMHKHFSSGRPLRRNDNKYDQTAALKNACALSIFLFGADDSSIRVLFTNANAARFQVYENKFNK